MTLVGNGAPRRSSRLGVGWLMGIITPRAATETLAMDAGLNLDGLTGAPSLPHLARQER